MLLPGVEASASQFSRASRGGSSASCQTLAANIASVHSNGLAYRIRHARRDVGLRAFRPRLTEAGLRATPPLAQDGRWAISTKPHRHVGDPARQLPDRQTGHVAPEYG